MMLGVLPTLALADGAPEMETTELSITKTVQQGGNVAPGAAEFTFELLLCAEEDEAGNLIYRILDTATITTNGAGSRDYTLSFQTPKDVEDEVSYATVETIWYDVYLREKPGSDPHWDYSDALYHVVRSTNNDGSYSYTFALCGEYSVGEPQTKAEFTNTYTANRYEIPFTKTVKLGGNTAPGQQAFELEIFDVGNSGLTDYNDLYTARLATNGAGTYEGKLIISGSQTEVEALVCEGFFVREKNAGKANWSYSDVVWYVGQEMDDDEPRLVIRPTHAEENDSGIFYVPDRMEEVPAMAFENTYTDNTDYDDGTTITVKKRDAVGTPLAGAVFVLNNSRGDAVYEATSNSRGDAQFTGVGSGVYTLLEQAAPDGYVASDKSYTVEVNGDRVTVNGKPYAPVTFVNRKAAHLNRDDHYTFLVGYSGRIFGPERNMTRAEVTTMFARLLTEQIEADRTYPNTFQDVPKSHWAANYIGYMQQFGIIVGYQDGTFRPDAPVTRAEFAAIASRFEKLTAGTKGFTDVPSTHWAAKYINFAATRGWVGGYPDGTFRPENPITRAEVAAVTCRLLERSADRAYVRSHLEELRTFRDMTESHWAYWYAMEAANGHDYTRSGSGEQWTALHP